MTETNVVALAGMLKVDDGRALQAAYATELKDTVTGAVFGTERPFDAFVPRAFPVDVASVGGRVRVREFSVWHRVKPWTFVEASAPTLAFIDALRATLGLPEAR